MRKKYLFIVFIVVTILLGIFLTGCKNQNEQKASGIQNNESSTEMVTPRIIYSNGDWVYYENLSELIEKSDYVILGKVVSVLPVERWDENPELDYGWTNISPFRVKVDEVICGEIKKGEILDIRMCGGRFEGISENDKFEIIDVIEDGIDGKYMKENHKYLLFVKGEEYKELDIIFPYYLATPWFGMTEIIEGRLETDKRNGFFEYGTTVEEAKAMIVEAESKKDTEN